MKLSQVTAVKWSKRLPAAPVVCGSNPAGLTLTTLAFISEKFPSMQVNLGRKISKYMWTYYSVSTNEIVPPPHIDENLTFNLEQCNAFVHF
jgi:hypothetical protein